MNLSDIRHSIDDLDEQIIRLLHRRFDLVQQVGHIKKEDSAPIFVPEREAALYARISRHNAGKLPEKALKAIYREIISCSFILEGNFKVAYLGPEGTWSHQAAIQQFGSSIDMIPCPGFKEVFDAVERENASYGVVPVENSTYGSVAPVMDIFVNSPLRICAQMQLRIQNCLLGNINRDEIRTIYSHPQILGQCHNWIERNYPDVRLIETASSTEAARIAAERAAEGVAAIGSPLAAQLNKLSVLEENIQDHPFNKTRFVIIGTQETKPTGNDRTSLCFTVHHRAGSLADVLDRFKKHGINLWSIESRPSRQVDWEYVFYVDVEGHALNEPLKSCLLDVGNTCSFLKVFGSFPETSSL